MVVDRSGRGHCIASLVAADGHDVHYIPGCPDPNNPQLRTATHISLVDTVGVTEYARANQIDIAFVTNVAALSAGVVDALRQGGIAAVGPVAAASRLENSKVFAKSLFAKYRIPSPEYRSFSDAAEASAFVNKHRDFSVIKADGLCGGNGAFVCDSVLQAEQAIRRVMVDRVFGASGDRVVVERRHFGQELSFFAVLDRGGWRVLPMAIDYPRTDDGNRGPISGGMGALSHHPSDTPDTVSRIERELLAPVRELIEGEGLDYTGFIYLGVMVSEGRPLLLEINVRMGEPETEVILPRLGTSVTDLLMATLDGRVAYASLRITEEHFCDVVAVQGSALAIGDGRLLPGWPIGSLPVGQPVTGYLDIDRRQCLGYLGEARVDSTGQLVSDGGRVIHVVGRGPDRETASRRAYDQIRRIHFAGIRFRHDIGTVMPWDDLSTGKPL